LPRKLENPEFILISRNLLSHLPGSSKDIQFWWFHVRIWIPNFLQFYSSLLVTEISTRDFTVPLLTLAGLRFIVFEKKSYAFRRTAWRDENSVLLQETRIHVKFHGISLYQTEEDSSFKNKREMAVTLQLQMDG
jgi:hypothetical protein